MKDIVIWYNPNKNTYYFKYVNNIFDLYYVGKKNQYNHIVILVINLYKENIICKQSILKRVLNKIICFLQNIYRKL